MVAAHKHVNSKEKGDDLLLLIYTLLHAIYRRSSFYENIPLDSCAFLQGRATDELACYLPSIVCKICSNTWLVTPNTLSLFIA